MRGSFLKFKVSRQAFKTHPNGVAAPLARPAGFPHAGGRANRGAERHVRGENAVHNRLRPSPTEL